MHWPISTALIAGPSMFPTLRHGDAVVVWRGLRGGGVPVRRGDVVLARFPALPDRLVVKRVVRAVPNGGWWVEGDNPEHSHDSRSYGPAEVLGRVVWRYWPPLRRGAG